MPYEKSDYERECELFDGDLGREAMEYEFNAQYDYEREKWVSELSAEGEQNWHDELDMGVVGPADREEEEYDDSGPEELPF